MSANAAGKAHSESLRSGAILGATLAALGPNLLKAAIAPIWRVQAGIGFGSTFLSGAYFSVKELYKKSSRESLAPSILTNIGSALVPTAEMASKAMGGAD